MATETTKPATLAEALVALQSRLPQIAKTRRANAGQYAYDYASLDDVSRALLPVLAEVGLAFTARPTLDEGHFVLAYTLWHAGGERVEGAYPLPLNGSPQALGSAISYGRRYALCAVTGAVAHDDDDGQAASERPAARASRARKSAPAEETPPPAAEPTREGNGPRPLADSQRRKIMALWGQLSMSGEAFRAARLQLTSEWLGRPVASTNELTMREGAQLVGCLEARLAEPPAGHDDGPTA